MLALNLEPYMGHNSILGRTVLVNPPNLQIQSVSRTSKCCRMKGGVTAAFGHHVVWGGTGPLALHGIAPGQFGKFPANVLRNEMSIVSIYYPYFISDPK